ncbi:MAG: cyclopropane-fatty-acyl-phospholipid synthase family protein [Planctomycetaceae bacterium]
MIAHLLTSAMSAAETGKLPDAAIRAGIRRLLKTRLEKELAGGVAAQQERLQELIDELRSSPIALETDAANEQHYEVPPEFFVKSLGPRLKYSCCHFEDGVSDLKQAEESALTITCERAGIEDGMSILDMGCGWGSFSLWAAEKYPNCNITSVSNSAPQRKFIEQRAASLGLTNIKVLTADMNEFKIDQQFDRIVSVEMFEHMRNYQELLGRVSTWLKPDGKLFIHIFCHRTVAYPFTVEGKSDWMAKHFFTGGIMPSASLLAHFQDDVRLEQQWHWNGQHYEKTSNAWLAEMDKNRDTIIAAFKDTYGNDADRWFGRWRIFHMACAELFGYNGGDEWFVTHMRFSKRL